MNNRLFAVVSMLAFCIQAQPVMARVQLVALPDRQQTIVRLDHPGATLVEEERVLTLQQGLNRVDFSWRGVRIDPDSIRLQILDHPDEVRLLNVSYPPGENALVWEIAVPDLEGAEVRVRIAYLLDGIDRLVTYKARVDLDEKTMEFQPNLVIRNFSGEAFLAAQFVMNDETAFQRDMDHEETKRLVLRRIPEVQVEKTFTWNAQSQPHDPRREKGDMGIPVHYVITNDTEHALGLAPLLEGKARIEQATHRGGSVFLGEDHMAYTPTGKEASLYVGDSRDILVTQSKIKERRLNIRNNRKGKIVLYDTEEIINVEIESFMDKPVTVTLLEPMPEEWEIVGSNFPYEIEHAQLLRFLIPVKPHSTETLNLHFYRRNVR